MGHLVCGIDYFDLVIFCLQEGTARSRKVTPIYPTPPKYQKTFCPFIIFSNYFKARNELGFIDDNNFLFPKMNSTFEQGTNRHILALSDPPKCIPTCTFNKKFKLHVSSEDLRKVGVNSM